MHILCLPLFTLPFPFCLTKKQQDLADRTGYNILALSAMLIASCFANNWPSLLCFQCSTYFQLLLFWYNSFVAYDDTIMCVMYLCHLHIWRYVVTGSLVLSTKFKLNKCWLSLWWSRVRVSQDLCFCKILLQRTLQQVDNFGRPELAGLCEPPKPVEVGQRSCLLTSCHFLLLKCSVLESYQINDLEDCKYFYPL